MLASRDKMFGEGKGDTTLQYLQEHSDSWDTVHQAPDGIDGEYIVELGETPFANTFGNTRNLQWVEQRTRFHVGYLVGVNYNFDDIDVDGGALVLKRGNNDE